MKYSGQMDRMSYLKHDTGETLCDFPLETLYTRVGFSTFSFLLTDQLTLSYIHKVKARACPIARTDLQKILYDGAGHDTVTLNKQVVDYEPSSEGITVTFADGSKETGDFLVIADGTHSKLRNKVCGESIERKYVGYINFNAAVPQSVVGVS